MRGLLFVRMVVVEPMHGHPFPGSGLHAAHRHKHEEPLQPNGHLEATMSQKPVITDVDALSVHMHSNEHDNQPRSTG